MTFPSTVAPTKDISQTTFINEENSPASKVNVLHSLGTSMKRFSLNITATFAGIALLTIYGCGGGSGSSTPEATPSSEVASLPSNLLTQAASNNCAALRSGKYNQIMLVADSLGITEKIDKWVVDAATNTLWNSAGTSSTPLVSTGELCRYTIAGGTEFVVSQAGVMVMRFGRASTKYLGVNLPEQTFTLAEMEGTWNTLGMDSTNPGTYDGAANTATINSTGTMTAFKRCRNAATWDVTSCVDLTTGNPSLRSNSDGGFDVVDSTNAVIGRMFAYKAGNGDVMGVSVTSSGTFQLFTKQRTHSLATVGAVTSNWNLVLNNLLTSPSVLSAYSNTIVSTESTNQSWVHSLETVGGTDAHPETLFANNPRIGYIFRPSGTALASDGTTATIAEFTGLNLRGMGLRALLLPSQKNFVFAVTKP